jgi:Fic family protein
MASATSPIDEALQWWHSRGDREAYLVPVDEIPSASLARILLKGRYAFEVAGRRAWILRVPHGPDDRAIFLLNYWRVVALVLGDYHPAAVTGVDAVRLHLEEGTIPTQLRVRHGASLSKYRLTLFEEYQMRLIPDIIDGGDLVTATVQQATVSVESPATTLLNLTLDDMRDNLDVIRPWVRRLYISARDVTFAYRRDPKPVRLQRAVELARELGNARLAETLATILLQEYPHTVSRTATRLGTITLVAETSDVNAGTLLAVPDHVSPWLERQATTFSRFARTIQISEAATPAQQDRLDPDKLLSQARQAKSYDAYHSTTMEGYRITPEGVEAALHGHAATAKSHEELRAQMAIMGYSVAFESVLRSAEEALRSGTPPIVTESTILDLYLDLFSPSVDAGIVDTSDLRGWRTRNVSLVGWRHIPPNPAKVSELMGQYTRLVNALAEQPLTRAILAHLDFVTVHPFLDGNGRLARLLMNLILLGSGLPWLTIRNDERSAYFEALERAQVNEDVQPFTAFITRGVAHATKTFRKE